MGCCSSKDFTPMIISLEAIKESTKLIPFTQLVKDYRVSVDMVLTNIFEFSPAKQLEYIEIILKAHPSFGHQLKSVLMATTETLLTEWRPSILASWGIIFEHQYRPIWTLQVPTSAKNINKSLVMVIDLDHVEQNIFLPTKVCC